jgi:hypothetical protein
MLYSRRLLLTLVLCAAWSSQSFAQPIMLGQIDNFQDGTTQNWRNGMSQPGISNIPTGGPAGAGDRYLQVSSGGANQPRSIVFNTNQWTGNYVAAGVTEVEMDVANFGTSSVSMRFALRSGPLRTSPGYVLTTPLVLPPDHVWRHLIVQLDAAHLTPISSPAPLSTFLLNVAEARVLNSAAPSLMGDAGTFVFGVDNIHAFAIPEPTTWMLLVVGLLGGTSCVTWFYSNRKLAEAPAIEEMKSDVQV